MGDVRSFTEFVFHTLILRLVNGQTNNKSPAVNSSYLFAVRLFFVYCLLEFLKLSKNGQLSWSLSARKKHTDVDLSSKVDFLPETQFFKQLVCSIGHEKLQKGQLNNFRNWLRFTFGTDRKILNVHFSHSTCKTSTSGPICNAISSNQSWSGIRW